jgi:predicted nucleic acid-binding protein
MLRGNFTFTEFTDRAALVARLPVHLHDARDSVTRITELAHNATPYDAAYLALAERLDCPLVTCDTKLADIPGTRAKVLIL